MDASCCCDGILLYSHAPNVCVCAGERERRHVLGCVGEKPTFHMWMTCMPGLASKAGRCRLARRYNVYSTHRNGTPVP